MSVQQESYWQNNSKAIFSLKELCYCKSDSSPKANKTSCS